MEPLTTKELTLIGYIEQEWHAKGKFPRAELVLEKFDLDIKELVREKETFKKALVNRGIKYPNYDLGEMSYDGLSNEQVSAIVTVLNFEDRRSRPVKLKEMGITAAQWAGWLKEPDFKAYLQELSARNFHDAIDHAHEGLVKTIQRGDVNGIKLFMELTGRASSNLGSASTEQNIKIILQRLVEVIQRHVKDPEILRLIGQDFEKVMNGEKLDEMKVIDARI